MARLTPASLKRRLRQAGDLVRLAEMRRELARRGLADARAVLAGAHAAVDAAEQAIRDLDAEQQARRDVLVQPMLGSAELRGSLEGVLNTLTADRERIHELEARRDAAKEAVVAAEAQVEAARGALLAAERRLDTRRRLREPLVDARNRQAERNDEAEAEERRLSRAAPRGTVAPSGGGGP